MAAFRSKALLTNAMFPCRLLVFEDQTVAAHPTFKTNLTTPIEVDPDARQIVLSTRNYLRPSLVVLSPRAKYANSFEESVARIVYILCDGTSISGT